MTLIRRWSCLSKYESYWQDGHGVHCTINRLYGLNLWNLFSYRNHYSKNAISCRNRAWREHMCIFREESPRIGSGFIIIVTTLILIATITTGPFADHCDHTQTLCRILSATLSLNSVWWHYSHFTDEEGEWGITRLRDVLKKLQLKSEKVRIWTHSESLALNHSMSLPYRLLRDLRD